MKRLIVVTLLLAPALCFGQGDGGVACKNAYRPQTDYYYNLEETLTDKVTFATPAGDEIASAIIEGPLESEKNTHREIILSMGKADAAGVFPVNFLVTRSPGLPDDLPEGLLIFGHGTTNGVTLDSVSSSRFDEVSRSQLLEVARSIVQPKEREAIRPGESFTEVAMTRVAVFNATVNVKITTRYTLNRIEDEIAYFDIIQTCEKEDNKQRSITVSGEGKGEWQHHITGHFSPLYACETAVRIGQKQDAFSVRTELTLKSVQTVTVVAPPEWTFEQ